MKFAAKALLILATFAGLGGLAVRNIMQAVAIERRCGHFMMVKRRLDDIARQEIRLCELALASQPDTQTIKAAEAKFQQIQLRHGQLKIEDPQALAIVSIPEMRLKEHDTSTWRIYAPPDQPFELAAFVRPDNLSRTPPSEPIDDLDFTYPLPAGESVVQFVWHDRYASKWGSFYSKDMPPTYSFTVSVNDDDFAWQRKHTSNIFYVLPFNYASQKTLADSEDTAELLRLGAWHLVVRRSQPTVTE